jgi:hypothetical protein
VQPDIHQAALFKVNQFLLLNRLLVETIIGLSTTQTVFVNCLSQRLDAEDTPHPTCGEIETILRPVEIISRNTERSTGIRQDIVMARWPDTAQKADFEAERVEALRG